MTDTEPDFWEEESFAEIERLAAEMRARGATPVVLALHAGGRRCDGITLGAEAMAMKVLTKEEAIGLVDSAFGGRGKRLLSIPTDFLGDSFRFLLLHCPAGPAVELWVVADDDGELCNMGGIRLNLETFRARPLDRDWETQW